jgi:chromosome segregation ATPase
MKANFTNSRFSAKVIGAFSALVVFTVLLNFTGCSSGIEQSSIPNETSFYSDKSFSFKEEGSDWRVDFNDDEIYALYKDGSRLPDNEIEKYREMIYEKIDALKSDQDKLANNIQRFHFDIDKFNEKMKIFKENIDDDKFMNFKIEFDEEEFEKNMEKLEESLKHLKDKKIDLYFDSEEFKEKMEKLEQNLKNLPVSPSPQDIEIEVHLDMDKFKESMKNFGESFKNFDFKFDSSEFDMSELRESMKELKKNMKGLKIEMHDLKGEMKKLNSFLKELKTELVKDGYLNSVEDQFDLEMNKDYIKVNDVNVKAEDHTKYKELYKKHFDKEIDGTIKINRD